MQDDRKRRYTVGVLAGWQVYERAILRNYLGPLLEGIQTAAQQTGDNLLLACGVGSSIDFDLISGAASGVCPAWPALSETSDFVPVGPWNCDGLIAISPLMTVEREQYIHALVAQGFPVVFIGAPQAGPSVGMDNASGIRQAMAHLYAHGHRRIAFIAGIPGDESGDSAERLRAYRQARQTYQLDTDPRLVVYGFHNTESAYQATQRLLESGASFSAIMASSDEAAIGALQALQAAGLRVPEDVALIGFDDQPAAAVQPVPLTSVHSLTFERGYRAFELLRGSLHGQRSSAEVVTIPTLLTVRQSCGCLPANAYAHVPPPPSRPIAWERLKLLLSIDLAESILTEVRALESQRVQQLSDALVSSFSDSLERQDGAPFLGTLQLILAELEALDGSSTHALLPGIALLRARLPTLIEARDWQTPQPALYQLAEQILHQALLTLGNGMQRQHRHYAAQQRRTTDQVAALTAQLLTAVHETQIFEILNQRLPKMGIAHASVVFFEPYDDDPIARGSLRAIPAQPVAALQVATRQFPPAGLFDAERPFHLALLPLKIQSQQVGFVAFESNDLELCGAIVYQLAAAFSMARLYHEATEGRRLAEQGQRLAEEASRMKSRFLYTVSHELRTPLHVITGLSELLLQPAASPQPDALPDLYRQDLERISTSAQHLDSLIRDVLDLARSEGDQLRLSCEPLELAAVLEPVCVIGAQLAQDQGLSWQSAIPADLPRIWGDQARLRQIVLNLLSNAIKFTRQGGVTLSLEVGAEVVALSVSDTGLGIPPEEQLSIFDEFRQSERTSARGYSGLGLGLAICKRLVQLHQGQLSVRSSGEEGAGSTFTVTLPIMALDYLDGPVEAGDLDSMLRQRWPEAAPALERTILLVDDASALLDLHARALAAQSPRYRVITARNGHEALEVLRAQTVDMVLLDLMMPELDGFGLLEAMQADAQLSGIPVIVLTGQVLNTADMGRLSRRVDKVLQKGVFRADETLTHIELALARARGLAFETQTIVRRAMAYLHEHYAEPISRDEVARYVGVSNDYLTRCFKQELGIPLLTYLNRYRIERAKALLSRGRKSITEVAVEVGFSNINYFCRIFRREVGVPPGAYRVAS